MDDYFIRRYLLVTIVLRILYTAYKTMAQYSTKGLSLGGST